MGNNQTIFNALEQGKSVNGFFLEGAKQIGEIGCKLWTLRHGRSGGRLVFIDSGTEEKSFSLSFPAFPEDDTGVFHIIEHCLVGAGEKYRVNEWMEQGPQKSFLSAFTCLDSSVYPVCSKNEKAFQDLVRIYSDAVFNSRIRSSCFPLLQEGWHYEYDRKTDELSCSGIVYSEVKAAHDLPYYLVTLTRLKAAFPDSPYAKDIGGAPEYVPSLTNEHFLEVYDRVFRPENCLACISGDTELKELLETLEPYFDRDPAAEQKPCGRVTPAVWDGSPLFAEYPCAKEESGQAILGFNWVFGQERLGVALAGLAVELLAPRLRERLTGAGLCRQVEFSCDCEPLYPLFTLTLSGARADSLDAARTEVLHVIEELLRDGVTEEQFETALAAAEFAVREGEGLVPDGIALALKLTSAFVHDLPLCPALLYEDAFRSIRASGWNSLADFIRRVFVDNDWHTEFVLLASDTLAARKERAEKLRMRMVRSRMDAEDIANVLSQQKKLKEYHDRPDDPEALALLPKTEQKDLAPCPPALALRELKTEKGTLLYLDSRENVLRLTLHFPVERFDDDFLHSVGVLSLLLGKTGTAKRTAAQVRGALSRLTGGLLVLPTRYADREERVFLELRCSMLPDSFEEAQELLREILLESDFCDRETLRAVLTQHLQEAKSRIPDPAARACAYFARGAAAVEKSVGWAFTEYVQSLLQDFDARFPQLCRTLAQTAEVLLASGKQTVGIACAEALRERAERQLCFSSALTDAVPCTAELLSPREAFRANGVMQYNALCGKAEARSGALLAACAAGGSAMRRILRETRGAYIVRLDMTEEGEVRFRTGRDPQLGATIETFRSVPDMICALDDAALSGAVVKAAESFFGADGRADIGGFKKRDASAAAFRSYWCGLTGQARQTLWHELVTATPQQIRAAAELLRPVCEAGAYCSWASEKRLAEDASLFDTVR